MNRPSQSLAAGLAAGMVCICASSAVHAASIEDSAAALLGLRTTDVQQIVPAIGPHGHVLASLRLGDANIHLDLPARSVRSEAYELLVTDSDGRLVPHEIGPVSTWGGAIEGYPDGTAVAALVDGGWRIGIRPGDGSIWWAEPLAGRVYGAGLDDYAVYTQRDVITPGGWCGTTADFIVGQPDHGGDRGGEADARGSAPCVADLACDADYEYYQLYGQSTAAVEERINAVVAGVNLQYEAQVDLTHQITTIVVRSYPDDPYDGNSMEQRLYQFRNYWNANYDHIDRDLAQLFTGSSDSGSTIGIAWVGAVCTDYHYSVVEADCCGSFGCATDLSAHEFGHNWNAGHCDCTNNTMNPYLTCSNDFTQGTINSITSYAQNIQGCLYCGPPLGACCTGANCTVTTELGCLLGTWLGNGSSCADDPCAPIGACCVDLDCSEQTESDCLAGGGEWLGSGATCVDNPCDPAAACCLGETCTTETEADCFAAGGDWLGAGTSCTSNPCVPIPEGACCLGTGCYVLSEASCNGTWLGAGTVCTPDPCSDSNFAGIDYAIVGTDLVPDIGENWTVDVFAVMGETERLDAVAGNANQQKTIESTGGFWQSSVGGPTSQDVNPAFYPLEPTLEWDSRVTIGGLDSSGDPFPENNLGDIGIDWSSFESGGGFSAGNGTWYILPIDEQGEARAFTSQDCAERHGVLIARLTVLGDASEVLVEALFQGRDGAGQGWQQPASRLFDASGFEDCNANGTSDSCDIAGGTSEDTDGNGVPDECESTCTYDIDGDGDVDIDDILNMIGSFGNPYTIDDLLGLLGEFGCGTG